MRHNRNATWSRRVRPPMRLARNDERPSTWLLSPPARLIAAGTLRPNTSQQIRVLRHSAASGLGRRRDGRPRCSACGSPQAAARGTAPRAEARSGRGAPRAGGGAGGRGHRRRGARAGAAGRRWRSRVSAAWRRRSAAVAIPRLGRRGSFAGLDGSGSIGRSGPCRSPGRGPGLRSPAAERRTGDERSGRRFAAAARSPCGTGSRPARKAILWRCCRRPRRRPPTRPCASSSGCEPNSRRRLRQRRRRQRPCRGRQQLACGPWYCHSARGRRPPGTGGAGMGSAAPRKPRPPRPAAADHRRARARGPAPCSGCGPDRWPRSRTGAPCAPRCRGEASTASSSSGG